MHVGELPHNLSSLLHSKCVLWREYILGLVRTIRFITPYEPPQAAIRRKSYIRVDNYSMWISVQGYGQQQFLYRSCSKVGDIRGCHVMLLQRAHIHQRAHLAGLTPKPLLLVAVVATLGLVMEAIDQWFPKFIQQVAPLTYWTIDCGSPLGLQSYILCRAEDFCKDSEAGRFPWFPSKPHLTVCHRGSNIWLCPRTLCNLPMELLERMLLQSQEKLLFI